MVIVIMMMMIMTMLLTYLDDLDDVGGKLPLTISEDYVMMMIMTMLLAHLCYVREEARSGLIVW